jgi:hypothetical protein
MPLTGTFDCLDIEETLLLLGRRKATGHLHLRAASTSATLALLDGRVVGAKVENRNGKLHTLDWHELAEELCCRAIRQQRGSLEFVTAEVEPWPGEPMLPAHLVDAARRRAEQWAEIETVIPSGDVVPRLATALHSEQIAVDRDQWPLLLAIDGRRTIWALARRLDVGLLRCCQLLKPLVEVGAVALPPGSEPIPLRPAPAKLADGDDLATGAEQASTAGEAPERASEAPEGAEGPEAPTLFAGVRILGRYSPPAAVRAS